jgi:AcrR family transcriptional regulator
MAQTTRTGTTRRDALVAAALSCVEEFGPGVGMAPIAERAGVPRPHVYRVVASKEELDAEVGRLAADMFVERVARQVTLIQQDLLPQLGVTADDYAVYGRL